MFKTTHLFYGLPPPYKALQTSIHKNKTLTILIISKAKSKWEKKYENE